MSAQVKQFIQRVRNGAADELSPRDYDQLSTLLDAFDEYVDKNVKYNDLWQQGGAHDSAHHVRHKSMRVAMTLDGMDPAHFVEDAIDIINYAVFFIRNTKVGRVHGT